MKTKVPPVFDPEKCYLLSFTTDDKDKDATLTPICTIHKPPAAQVLLSFIEFISAHSGKEITLFELKKDHCSPLHREVITSEDIIFISATDFNKMLKLEQPTGGARHMN